MGTDQRSPWRLDWARLLGNMKRGRVGGLEEGRIRSITQNSTHGGVVGVCVCLSVCLSVRGGELEKERRENHATPVGAVMGRRTAWVMKGNKRRRGKSSRVRTREIEMRGDDTMPLASLSESIPRRNCGPGIRVPAYVHSNHRLGAPRSVDNWAHGHSTQVE